MKTTRILALATMTALSIGVGTAMAQDGGQAYPDYWAPRQSVVPGTTTTTTEATIQSGSADLGGSGGDHTATTILKRGLAGAGGVGG